MGTRSTRQPYWRSYSTSQRTAGCTVHTAPHASPMVSVETVTQHSIRMCRCLTGVINRFKEARRGGLLGIEKRLTLFIRLLRPESGLACVSCRCRCRRTVLQPGPLLGEQVVEDVPSILLKLPMLIGKLQDNSLRHSQSLYRLHAIRDVLLGSGVALCIKELVFVDAENTGRE